MAQVLRRRFWSGGYVSALGLVWVVAFGGCGESSDRAERKPPRAPSEFAPAVAETLVWPDVAGAAEYQVQAWSQLRLLFSERTSAPRLAMSPSLERATRFFPDTVLRIEARGADGRALGERIEMTMESARRSDR